MIFLQKLVFTFIYPIDLGQYEGKTKFLTGVYILPKTPPQGGGQPQDQKGQNGAAAGRGRKKL